MRWIRRVIRRVRDWRAHQLHGWLMGWSDQTGLPRWWQWTLFLAIALSQERTRRWWQRRPMRSIPPEGYEGMS
jgi:hypothetical protein